MDDLSATPCEYTLTSPAAAPVDCKNGFTRPGGELSWFKNCPVACAVTTTLPGVNGNVYTAKIEVFPSIASLPPGASPTRALWYYELEYDLADGEQVDG
jgi:hypothetical protein